MRESDKQFVCSHGSSRTISAEISVVLSLGDVFLSILRYDHDPDAVDMKFKQILYPRGRMRDSSGWITR